MPGLSEVLVKARRGNDLTAGSSSGGNVVLVQDQSREDKPLQIEAPFYPTPQDPRADEPLLPLHSTLNTIVSKWVKWAELHMQELYVTKLEAESERASARREMRDLNSALYEKNRQIQRLQYDQTEELQRANANIKAKIQETDQKKAALEKREKALKVAEAKAKRLQAESKTYHDLGVKIERGVSEMRMMIARKNNLQSAVDKWEKVHCEPVLHVVEIGETINSERAEMERKYAEHMKEAKMLKNQLNERANQLDEDTASLFRERQEFTTEKENWRSQQARALSWNEMKSLLEVRVAQEVGKLKPSVLAAAKTRAWADAKVEWNAIKAPILEDVRRECEKVGYRRGDSCGYVRGKSEGWEQGEVKALRLIEEAKAKAKDEGEALGYIEGHEDGRKEGDSHGWQNGWDAGKKYGEEIGHDRGKEEGLSEGYEMGESEGYERGRQAGHSQGHQKGFAKGKAEGIELSSAREFNDGYDEGRKNGFHDGHLAGKDEGFQDGYEEGNQKGYKEGYKEGLQNGYEGGYWCQHKDRDEEGMGNDESKECFYRGFHKGILFQTWATPEFWFADRVPNPEHPYWLGRSVTQCVLEREGLEYPEDPWYGADEEDGHPLTLIRPSNVPRTTNSYWNGIKRGLSGHITLVKDWEAPDPSIYRGHLI